MHLASNKQDQITYHDKAGYDNDTLQAFSPNFRVSPRVTWRDIKIPREYTNKAQATRNRFDFNRAFSSAAGIAGGIFAAKQALALQKLQFQREQLAASQGNFQSFSAGNPLTTQGMETPSNQSSFFQTGEPNSLSQYMPVIAIGGGVLLLVLLMKGKGNE